MSDEKKVHPFRRRKTRRGKRGGLKHHHRDGTTVLQFPVPAPAPAAVASLRRRLHALNASSPKLPQLPQQAG